MTSNLPPEAVEAAPCWLCLGLGGIAVHNLWTERRGNGKPLWTAHGYPSADPHPVIPCPACDRKHLAAAIRERFGPDGYAIAEAIEEGHL